MSGFVDDVDGGEVVCVDEDDFGPFVPPEKCDDQGGVQVTTDGGDLDRRKKVPPEVL